MNMSTNECGQSITGKCTMDLTVNLMWTLKHQYILLQDLL